MNQPVKGFFSGLKGLIIQEDETVKTPAVAAPQISQPVSSTTSFVGDTSTPVMDVVSLEAAIDAAIQENPEFEPMVRFQKACTALDAVLPQESTRFSAAAATSQLDLQTLATAIDSRRGVLINETENFETAFVSAANSEIAATTEKVNALTEEITAITAKLGELSEQKNLAEREVIEQTTNLEKAKIDFAGVIANVEKRYSTTATKLQQYLGAK